MKIIRQVVGKYFKADLFLGTDIMVVELNDI